jgi:hypothetical protein
MSYVFHTSDIFSLLKTAVIIARGLYTYHISFCSNNLLALRRLSRSEFTRPVADDSGSFSNFLTAINRNQVLRWNERPFWPRPYAREGDDRLRYLSHAFLHISSTPLRTFSPPQPNIDLLLPSERIPWSPPKLSSSSSPSWLHL